jgi:hypothetical protein
LDGQSQDSKNPVVWPHGRSGNYGIIKYFIDKSANE